MASDASTPEDHRFQVHLGGIIDLLSNHLYTSPAVVMRELLQNGVDAIEARKAHGDTFEPRIAIEVNEDPSKPSLVFEDNGIGLDEKELHAFLSTIGRSSKREEVFANRETFIGQFGIGLLSCFMLSEEIVAITASARDGSGSAFEWKGRSDGTYQIRKLDTELEPGTRVYLTAKPDYADYFSTKRIEELITHYGDLLPIPIEIRTGETWRRLNRGTPPWRNQRPGSPELLGYGADLFGEAFLEAIPLASDVGQVDGVAFIRQASVTPSSTGAHRVYLKGMLVSDSIDNILPPWAFFVRAVVSAQDLRPTASRESFYEDIHLEEASETLGQAIKSHIAGLADRDPKLLKAIIAIHNLSLKQVALEDPEFLKFVAPWLSFETSLGRMTLEEIREITGDEILYCTSVDQFRQLAPIASAQDECLVNAGYIYESEIMACLPDLFPHLLIELTTAMDYTESLADLTMEERGSVTTLLETADRVLQPFKVRAEIKRFRPTTLPVLFGHNEAGLNVRSLESSKEIADDIYGSLLDDISSHVGQDAYSELLFNYDNDLVQRLCQVEDRSRLAVTIRVLYLQSLLLGHHPLSAAETKLLNAGLTELIELGLDSK